MGKYPPTPELFSFFWRSLELNFVLELETEDEADQHASPDENFSG